MNVQTTAIDSVYVVHTNSFVDHRGAFLRCFCEHELAAVIGPRHIVQINFSRTHPVGAVRGLHFQRSPRAEMKLVRCLKGRVWDVAVDLRAGSPTFLQWHAEELSQENTRMMVIPEGCAHGFQVMESDAELLYLHTEFYAPAAEEGVAFNDPSLSITWPLPISDISERDRNHAFIHNTFKGIEL